MNLHFTEDFNSIITGLDKTTLNHVVEKLSPYKKELIDYNLVITGTVGSGKSTRCEALYHIFSLCDIKINTYPEYISIDDDMSKNMLKKKIDGDISSNTFQSYILDSWEKLLSSNNEPGLNLYERCIDDSFVCFCNIANKDNTISELQLLSLFERLLKINNKYKVPSYFDKNIHFTEIQSNDVNFNIKQIVDIMISDIKSNIKKRIIGLSISDFNSKERIKQRSRDAEDNYTMDVIRLFNSHYNKLFKLLNKHKHLTRLVDIGKLL